MKAQSIHLQSPSRAYRAEFVPNVLHRAKSLSCMVFMVLVSVLPAAAIIVLATWASGVLAALPVAQAAIGLTGFVFLALALDSSRTIAALQALTGLALFALAWASMSVSPEFLVIGAMVVASWVGTGLFYEVRQRCV